MTRRWVVLSVAGASAAMLLLVIPASATSQAQPVVRYTARLSANDHYHFKTGAKLRYASQVIRQDRLNNHAHNNRDREDQSDSMFGNFRARGQLAKLLQGRISPADERTITTTTPLVEVSVWPNYASVRVIANGPPVTKCEPYQLPRHCFGIPAVYYDGCGDVLDCR